MRADSQNSKIFTNFVENYINHRSFHVWIIDTPIFSLMSLSLSLSLYIYIYIYIYIEREREVILLLKKKSLNLELEIS